MTKIKLKYSIILIAVMQWCNLAQAQESANSSGGNASGSGGTATYSIGQVFCTTNTGSTGSVAQGVQQAYEIFNVGINKTTLNISLTVYPNPTTENLTIHISNFNNELLYFQLIDLNGKLLNSGQVKAQQTQINTSSLPAATYFVNISNQENQNVHSFKIIKK